MAEPRILLRLAMACLLAASSACGGGSGGGSAADAGPPPIPGLQSITVAPADQTLVIMGATPASSDYQATGSFADGHSEDVTGRVYWSIDDVILGRFEGATFTTGTVRGGITTVRAQAGDVGGSTGLTVRLQEVVNDPAATDLPRDPGSLFVAPDDPARAPALVYPNDGVLVPPNLQRLEVHFYAGTGNSLFALRFENDVTDVTVYLRCTPLNGGCLYLPDAQVWEWVAESNRGGAPVHLSMSGTDDSGSGVGTSPSRDLSFSYDDINGGIYYWTTSNGTAIMRFDFASPTQVAAEQVVGTELTDGTCVGCHALSRDGKKLVAEAGGRNDGRLLLLDMATLSPMVPFGSPPKSIFESWNPDGTQFVGVYGDSGASDYNLLLFDGQTGAAAGTIEVGGDADHPTDHPDWSPEGDRIAFAHVGETPDSCQRMYQASIQMVERSAGLWGAPEEIVPAEPGKNRYYPAFSPDGALLVFDESTCPGGTTADTDCNADTDPSARLFVVPARPAAAPVELARANQGGDADGGARDLTNSFPKWCPFVFQRSVEFGSRLEWVTFSSTRQYGLRQPPGGDSENPSGTLVWMAAVDPDKAIAGQDPSYPAFALPFQDLTTSNHIAQWTQAVVTPIP